MYRIGTAFSAPLNRLISSLSLPLVHHTELSLCTFLDHKHIIIDFHLSPQPVVSYPAHISMDLLKLNKQTRRSISERVAVNQRNAAIYRLPTEILYSIVSLAFKEGGVTTVYNLCLASRRLLAVADPFRFRFVSVAGTHQIYALLRVLKQDPARSKQIHALFLAESHPYVYHAKKHGLRKWLSFQRLLSKKRNFVEAAVHLISKIGPTLQALTFVVDSWFPEDYGSILSSSFPSLTRLNIRAPWFRCHSNPKFGTGNFPSLRSLHISTRHYLYFHNLCHLASLCQRCPQLETLKLSGALPDPDHFDSMWKQFCIVEPRRDTVFPVTPPLPTHIRRIILQNYHSDSEAPGFLAESGQLVRRPPIFDDDIEEGLLWLKPVHPPNYRDRVSSAIEELHRPRLMGLDTVETHSVRRVYPRGAFAYTHIPIALTVGVYA